MAVEYFSKPLSGHPITELQYDLDNQILKMDGIDLQIRTLAHVEKSIDKVFEWLEKKGRSPDEIEHLAPYFGVVWPSALALTGYLQQEKIAKGLKHQKILELGCGLAIPSILMAKLGGDVTATDSHPDVPRFLDINVELNEPCSIKFFSTAADDEVESCRSLKFDLIVASDVLYEQKLIPYFVEEIRNFAHSNSKVIVTDPGRPYIQEFQNQMSIIGWKSELVPWTVQFNGKPHDIFLLNFWR